MLPSQGLGVSVDTKRKNKKYRSRVFYNGLIDLGRYSTIHEARLAYDQAVLTLPGGGAFKATNYPPGMYVHFSPIVHEKINRHMQAIGIDSQDSDYAPWMSTEQRGLASAVCVPDTAAATITAAAALQSSDVMVSNGAKTFCEPVSESGHGSSAAAVAPLLVPAPSMPHSEADMLLTNQLLLEGSTDTTAWIDTAADFGSCCGISTGMSAPAQDCTLLSDLLHLEADTWTDDLSAAAYFTDVMEDNRQQPKPASAVCASTEHHVLPNGDAAVAVSNGGLQMQPAGVTGGVGTQDLCLAAIADVACNIGSCGPQQDTAVQAAAVPGVASTQGIQPAGVVANTGGVLHQQHHHHQHPNQLTLGFSTGMPFADSPATSGPSPAVQQDALRSHGCSTKSVPLAATSFSSTVPYRQCQQQLHSWPSSQGANPVHQVACHQPVCTNSFGNADTLSVSNAISTQHRQQQYSHNNPMAAAAADHACTTNQQALVTLQSGTTMQGLAAANVRPSCHQPQAASHSPPQQLPEIGPPHAACPPGGTAAYTAAAAAVSLQLHQQPAEVAMQAAAGVVGPTLRTAGDVVMFVDTSVFHLSHLYMCLTMHQQQHAGQATLQWVVQVRTSITGRATSSSSQAAAEASCADKAALHMCTSVMSFGAAGNTVGPFDCTFLSAVLEQLMQSLMDLRGLYAGVGPTEPLHHHALLTWQKQLQGRAETKEAMAAAGLLTWLCENAQVP